MDFKLLQKVVDELNSTNSTNDKKIILAKYKDDDFIKKVLYYTYNPFYQYYVTPATLEKKYDDDLGTLYEFSDLFEMLDTTPIICYTYWKDKNFPYHKDKRWSYN